MNSLSGELCPVCNTGRLQAQRIDYTVAVDGDTKVTVKNLPVDQCEQCGEVLLSAQAADLVDAAIAEQTEQLTARELERIREGFEVDQTEMSEILGLGSKTYHRWEKGSQVASRSMGYYLRILEEFPDAFAWLRERGWHRRNRVSTLPTGEIRFEDAFPDLAAIPSAEQNLLENTPRFNPAQVLFGQRK